MSKDKMKELADKLGISLNPLPAPPPMGPTGAGDLGRQVQSAHVEIYTATMKLMTAKLMMLRERGIRDMAPSLMAMIACAEAALVGLCPLVSDAGRDRKTLQKMREGDGQFITTSDSILFAGLLAWAGETSSKDPVGEARRLDWPRPMELAHDAFTRITGRTYKDVFLRTCDCDDCERRRQVFGAKKINTDDA